MRVAERPMQRDNLLREERVARMRGHRPTATLDRCAQAVERFARSEGLFRRPAKVLVALSGGPDSVACLLILRALRERFGLEIIAAHFDHKLRPESGADLDAVRVLCHRFAVECLTGEGDVARAATERRMGVEEAARRMRYEFLAFVAGKERAAAIVTGHTRDDQVETVLQRVLRGTGVRGLRGMLPSGPVPGAPSQTLVRPLLCLSRADTEAVCAESDVEPLRDPSNADPAYARNRIRHQTLPFLRTTNPSVDEALLGVAASAREVFGRIERETFAVQPIARDPSGSVFSLAPLAALPNEGVATVVEREAAFHRRGAAMNRTRLENLRGVLSRGRGRVAFGDAEVEASCGRVRIGPHVTAEPIEEKLLNVPGATLAGRWRVDVGTDPQPLAPGALHATLATAGQRGALRVRSPRPGDRISFRGLERNLADALANARVPAWERHGLLVVADSVRVRAVLGVPALADPPGGDALYVRATLRPPATPAKPGEGASG
jgi:tRNA(Ile)-lysidine synthase